MPENMYSRSWSTSQSWYYSMLMKVYICISHKSQKLMFLYLYTENKLIFSAFI